MTPVAMRTGDHRMQEHLIVYLVQIIDTHKHPLVSMYEDRLKAWSWTMSSLGRLRQTLKAESWPSHHRMSHDQKKRTHSQSIG